MANFYRLPDGQIVPASQVQQSPETGQWYYLANPTSPEGGWVAIQDGAPTATDSATPAERPLAQQLGMNSVQYERLRALGLSDQEIGARLQAYMQRTGATQQDPMNWGDDATNRVMGLASDPARERAQQNQIAADQQRMQAGNSSGISASDWGDIAKGVGFVAGAGSLGNWLLGSNALAQQAAMSLADQSGNVAAASGAGAGAGAGSAGSGMTLSEILANGPRSAAQMLADGTKLAGGTGGTGLTGGVAMDEIGGIGADLAGLTPAEMASIGTTAGAYNGVGGTSLLSQITSAAGAAKNVLGAASAGNSLLTSLLGPAVSGVVGLNAAGRAADAQLAGVDRSNATLLAMFDQNRADMAPYREVGTNALRLIADGIQPGADFNREFASSDFTTDPGYAFRLAEGEKALNRAAGARGMYGSGATMKALGDYNQNIASNEFDKVYNRFQNNKATRFNRLAAVAGIGQQATGSTAALGASTAGQIAGNQSSAGDVTSSGIVAGANALNNAIGGAYRNINDQSVLELLKGRTSSYA